MGMTLQQLYEQTRDRFKLHVLAGREYMNNDVCRLYYIEDIFISDWTRNGELLVTTAMQNKQDPTWLMRFVESVKPFRPSGIMVNTGGYVEEVPEEVVDYCAQIKLPLLSFPWETVLQDIMQDFTNRIFEAEQKENNISQAFLNAIFNPEERENYVQCLEKNGYGQYDRFLVTVLGVLEDSEARKYLIRQLCENCDNSVVIEQQLEVIMIVYDTDTDEVEAMLDRARKQWEKRFSGEALQIGIGTCVEEYRQVGDSYRKAKLCQEYGQKNGQNILSFENMGVMGILASCERKLLEQFSAGKLGILQEYDLQNQTDYLKTLECFLRHGCNGAEVSKEMFVHRNTVNYRLKKIRELLQEDFTKPDTILEYQIAFRILQIL